MSKRLFAACMTTLPFLMHEMILAADIDCAKPVDQVSMSQCADRNYRAADERLHAAYQALMLKVSPEGRQKLQSSLRAWITYRDAQCDFDTFGLRDGSIHPMMRSNCLAEMTEWQSQRLAQQLDCQEGDLSCGNQ